MHCLTVKRIDNEIKSPVFETFVSGQVHDFAIFVTQIVVVVVFLFEKGLHQDAFGHLTVAGDRVTVVDWIQGPNLDSVVTTGGGGGGQTIVLAALISRPVMSDYRFTIHASILE